MLVERPDQRQWKEMVAVYGTPTFEARAQNIKGWADGADAPICSGEVILLIFNLAGSCVFVRRTGEADWTLPMGRIALGEGIIEAAHREAIEVAGIRIIPLGVPLCQTVTMSFDEMAIQRWHLVVVAETADSALGPHDRRGVDDARFFDVPPPFEDVEIEEWMVGLHREGTRFMRSLDAMDGI